jgi:uncharacterized protein DUF4437
VLKRVLVIALIAGTGAVAVLEPRAFAQATASKLVPASEVAWVSARPGQDNSVLWGDPRSGPFGRFNRFGDGFIDRPHLHSRDLRVVVSGVMVVQVRDEVPKELGPGSYAVIAGGAAHTHSCKAGSSCVVFVEQDGPNDTSPARP